MDMCWPIRLIDDRVSKGHLQIKISNELIELYNNDIDNLYSYEIDHFIPRTQCGPDH